MYRKGSDELAAARAELVSPPGQGSARLAEIRDTAARTAAGAGIDLAKLGASVLAVGAIGDDLLGDIVGDGLAQVVAAPRRTGRRGVAPHRLRFGGRDRPGVGRRDRRPWPGAGFPGTCATGRGRPDRRSRHAD